MNEQKKLYPERDPAEFVDYYMRHVEAMTSEELFGKGDIAAQLAWRDREIDQLRQRVAEVEAELARLADVEHRAKEYMGVAADDRGYNSAYWAARTMKHLRDWQTRAKQAEAKLALAEQDARRYRWLRDVPCCTISVSRNDGHAVNYMSFEEWAADSAEWYEDVPADELERMKENNTDWAVQIYPDTPIGFHVFHGATLDTAIDAAIDASGHDSLPPHKGGVD